MLDETDITYKLKRVEIHTIADLIASASMSGSSEALL